MPHVGSLGVDAKLTLRFTQSGKNMKLDHIGIAVRSLASAKIYEDLGLTIEHVETVETQGVKTAFLSVGDSILELLEPTSPDSPIAKFIEKRGEGIHHICLRVENIEANLERLKAAGY